MGNRSGTEHGCLLSALMLPWVMLKLIFYNMPKAFLMLLRAVARSVSSQSTAASGADILPAGLGQLSPAQADAERVAAIVAISGHDPAFAATEVVRRALGVHDLIARSLADGDAGAARLVMADGLWGTRRMLLSVRSDNGVERQGSVTVVGTGLVLRGSRTPTRWHNDLIFTRSARAATPPSGGILASNCPNCGAPIRVSDDGACETCGALVMSGRHDWVLTGLARDPW